MKLSNSLALIAAVCVLSASAAHAASKVSAVVRDATGKTWKVDVEVSSSEAGALERSVPKDGPVVRRIKESVAEKMGYSRRVYGPDHWKTAGAMKVEQLRLTTASGSRDLRTSDEPDRDYHRDQEEAVYGPAEPPPTFQDQVPAGGNGDGGEGGE